MYHQPVLLQQCIEGLNIKPDGVYVDVTFGGGGHSNEILKHLGERGKLFAFDQDADAAKNVPSDKRFIFIPQNFMFMRNFLKMHGVVEVDGILADLGVSSHQFDVAERGFSIRFDAQLDMRMNQSADLTAAKVLNEYDENRLYKLFRVYGEVENTGKLVKTIIEKRAEKNFDTINEFKNAIASCIPKHAESKYLAKVFQALRIEVNNEEEVLKDFLTQSKDILKTGGRLVVMSYHSLEDRLVKNFIKTGNMEGTVHKDFFGNIHRPFELITRKPMVPDEAEIKNNSRARSAKLRIAEKAENGKPV